MKLHSYSAMEKGPVATLAMTWILTSGWRRSASCHQTCSTTVDSQYQDLDSWKAS